MTRSIQSLPNNSGTTSVTDVYSSAGFNAGDPVIFQNGDYKSPANIPPPSTVDFAFTEAAAISPNLLGGIIAPSFTAAQMQTGVGGGTPRRFASVLTNGNIVQAWSMYAQAPTNPDCVHFRIINPSGTVVVSPTLVSATFLSSTYACVSVVALAGGGFAVGWINHAGGTTNSVNYAIYDNTGSVITTATQDTSFAAGASYVPLEMTNLANGGFAIAIKNISGTIYVRSYNSVGVGSYTTINTSITTSNVEASFALTARNDNSVFVCDLINTITYTYSLYNSSGTAIVAMATFAAVSGLSSGTSVAGPDASVLPNGTTIVIGFNNNNGVVAYPSFRFLPTGNVLSAETEAIPPANVFYRTGYNGGYLSIQTLSSGNFILYFTDGFGNMQYAFYNSSGACISGSNSAGAIPLQITGGFCATNNRVTLIESNGFVYAYWTVTIPTQKPVQQVYCRINTSTFIVTPFISVNGTTIILGGQPTGAFNPSATTPSGLSYYSTASATSITTQTPATVSGPTILQSAAMYGVASCTLSNGNFVVAWKLSASSPYAIYANIYSSSGSFLSSVNVGTSTGTGDGGVRLAALSGGGFVVAFHSTTTTLKINVYTPTGNISGSTSFAFYNYSTTYNFDITGLANNNFAIFYNYNNSNGRVRIYSSSLAELQNIEIINTPQSISIVGNNWGGFAICTFRSASGYAFYATYVLTAPNTWVISSSSQITAMSAFSMLPQLCATQSGLYISTINRSGAPGYAMFTDSGLAQVSTTGALSSWPLGSSSSPTSYPMMGIGLTGNGNVVMATSYTSTFLGIGCLPAQITFSSGQPAPYDTASDGSYLVMFSDNAYKTSVVNGEASQVRITAGVGNNAILTFKSSNGYPAFMIVNGTNILNVNSVIANTTASALLPIAPITSSSNITGVMAGIAVTSATAGSTGQVAVSGQVLLNSSYTSTATGSFDQTGGAVSGVKGTFNGRSVNLQGNS